MAMSHFSGKDFSGKAPGSELCYSAPASMPIHAVYSNCRRCREPLFAFAALIVWIPCPGQTKTSATTIQTAAPPYAGEALVVEKAETLYRYEADGTGEKDVHEWVRLQSEAGARQFSVLSVAYASATESPQIEGVVAHHSDGSTTETPVSGAMDMPAPVTQQAPLYSDLKQLQIPVRGLRVGDVLEYRVHVQRKNPEAPSQFWNSYGFEKNAVTLSQTLTLDVPAGKYVQIWSPDHKPVITEKDGRSVYAWNGKQLKPTSSEPKTEASAPPTEIKPDVAWTTFHSWAEVGDWYRELSTPRIAVSDELRAQAEKITHDAHSPLDQVQALYSFVSTRIRYVGIDFGVGRYQPHMAADVLTNQYGDCKDKDTLLEALLHAKGFTTAPALIGANLAMVPELPSPAFFNHVITTVMLPNGRIWMDSTPGVAPFQLLLSPLRDKQALVIRTSGDADLERTPAQLPYPFVDTFEATGALDASGDLSAKVKMSFRSDNEILIRLVGQNLAPAQWDQGSQSIASMLGFGGTTSDSNFSRADDTSQPMELTYDYTRKPYGDWDNLRIIPLFPATLGLPDPPDKQPESEIDLGALRTENAVCRIQLPAGYGAEVPDAVHAKTAFATFDVTYKFENGEFTAERKLVVLQSRLTAASWEQYKDFTKEISLGELAWVRLMAPASAANRAADSGTNNADAARLIGEAVAFERISDLNGAQAKLDEAKQLNPEQPFLWSNYAYVAMRQSRFDDAKEDFRHELAHHPQESYVVRIYAGMMLRQQGDLDGAQTVLKSYFDRDAGDQPTDLMLASVQARKSVPDAIATLRRAIDAAPDKPFLQTALGDYLIRNHQESDAAVLMKKLLTAESDNANLLNDAAYVLARTNTDLALAEEKSRRSLDLLASQTADAEVSEANPAAFERSTLAVAAWDTLGFILLKQNKLDEARDYLEAAWHNRPEWETSLHFGELEEALGDRKEAMRIYSTMRPPLPGTGPNVPPAYEQLKNRMEHLESEGVRAPTLDPSTALLQERTFKLKLEPTKSSWSDTFRLELDARQIAGAMEVSGSSSRQGVIQAIKELSMPRLVPRGFKGRIVRDAVISCSAGKTECEFILIPMGGMANERARP